jgi:protein TonB|tara:strand:- start:10145 stop:11041 length:897 start_codon:yes stop_codon:yes gene_type:complete
MAAINPTVTPVDRLSFTGFLAVAVHATVILGITFTMTEKGPSTHTMEVTLAQHRSKNPPSKTDFLAQFNQLGSGTLREKILTTTTNRSEFHDTVIRNTLPQPQITVAPERPPNPERTLITTSSSSTPQAKPDSNKEISPVELTKITLKKSLLERSLEIASLEARLDRQRQIFAGRPRVKRLTSLATKASVDAFYLNSWRRKIERVGNLNYPEEARRRKLYGSLRLLVSILPGGDLKAVEILETSGFQVLDDAAIRIVKLAAPFAPFPDELRQTTDVLEIIRTWQFRKNSSLRTGGTAP